MPAEKQTAEEQTAEEQTTAEQAGQSGQPAQGPTDDAPQVWDRQPGEPSTRYGQFRIFLELGPARSMRKMIAEYERRCGLCADGSSTYDAARRWRWQARVLAWDHHQQDLLAVSEHNARLVARARRVAVLDEYLEAVMAVLDNAHLAEADEEQARRWLPQMRTFLRDLLAAQRQEYEQPHGRADAGATAISADDLRAAQRWLEAQAGPGALAAAGSAPAAAQREAGESAAGTSAAPGYHAPVLFVCIGPDDSLRIDLAALRAAGAATPLKVHRILDATRSKFADTLRRERGLGHPVELLHMALHAGPEGIVFVDGPAGGDWLSERLAGVRVLLLASCQGERIGDWLGVVPHVISLSEAISHEDAALLAQHFWHGVALGRGVDAALDQALTHCPPAVGEYVVRHW